MFMVSTNSVTSMHDRARARVKAGYRFPDAPSTHGQWTPEFNTFVDQCRNELHEIVSAHEMLDGYSMEHSCARDAERLFTEAAESKDMTLLRIYHRLIPSVENPNYIPEAVELMGSMTHSEPLHEIINGEHIRAIGEIRRALYLAAFAFTSTKMLDNAEVDRVIALALHDLSLTENIAMLIKRGIRTCHEIQETLKATSGIESPLIDGAL